MSEGLKKTNLFAALEAVLFLSGEPVEFQKLCEILMADSQDVEQAIQNLSEKLEQENSGLTLLKLGNKYQLSTKKDFAIYCRRALEVKRSVPLSQAAFEVLAVIAYNQPVTKTFIENVRGVDCSGVVNTLVEKGLVEEKGRLDLPGRPLIYGTTELFMKDFEISDLSELPQIPKGDDIISVKEDENQVDFFSLTQIENN